MHNPKIEVSSLVAILHSNLLGCYLIKQLFKEVGKESLLPKTKEHLEDGLFFILTIEVPATLTLALLLRAVVLNSHFKALPLSYLLKKDFYKPYKKGEQSRVIARGVKKRAKCFRVDP